MVQMLKNPPAMQETQVLSLGWEDPLEKEVAAHSSILAWEMPWTEEPGRLHPCGHKSLTRLSDTTMIIHTRTYANTHPESEHYSLIT